MAAFLNLIHRDLCHAEAVVPHPGPALYCTACRKTPIPNVYEYINQARPDYFASSELAQAYAEWTGDAQVPMSFPLSHIEGILDTVVVGQPLERVQKSVRLLRALNAPFTTDPNVEHVPDMDTFLPDFLNILYRSPAADTPDEQKALEALMKCMHDIFSQRDALNPFDIYFKVLVPYVTACLTDWHPFAAEPPHPNLARELHTQLVRSFYVRQLFGRYAIPFDVIHVMVGCYACSCNMDVVGNWAIDFLARVCRGEFFWQRFPQCVFVRAMQALVDREINYKRNTHYYKSVVKHFKSGDVIDQYSQMWQPLHEVQAYLKRRYFDLPHLQKVPSDVLDMAFAHTFPAALFRDCADQLGFVMGYNHLIMTMNRRSGYVAKGAFKKARLIHDVVRRFVTKLLAFDAGNASQKAVWNLDMVRLFFASDSDFQAEIMKVIHILVMEEDEEQ